MEAIFLIINKLLTLQPIGLDPEGGRRKTCAIIEIGTGIGFPCVAYDPGMFHFGTGQYYRLPRYFGLGRMEAAFVFCDFEADNRIDTHT